MQNQYGGIFKTFSSKTDFINEQDEEIDLTKHFLDEVYLIIDILKLTTSSNDIILDFFSGSATTAHAVMQLNAEDGGDRKFICVQLPEPCNEDTEAAKAGYKNICEIGKERIRRAGEKIKVEIEAKRNRFFYGMAMSSFNMFAIPWYALTTLMMSSKELFQYDIISILLFSLAAASGTYFVFYLYAKFFKLIEHKLTFIVQNINFLIAALTGIVAASSLYKMFF